MPRKPALATFLLLPLLLLLLSAVPLQVRGDPLKYAEISGFITSLQELQALGEQYRASPSRARESHRRSSGEHDGHWLTESVGAMRGHPVYEKIQAIVRAHGFQSAEQWGEVGDRVVRAFLAVSMDQQVPGMEAEMEKALQELEHSDSLTLEQKTIMRQSMLNSLAQVRSLTDAPPADIAAVRPRMTELESAFKDTGEPGGSSWAQ